MVFRRLARPRSLFSQSQTPTAPRSAVGFFRFGCLSGCPARLITQSIRVSKVYFAVPRSSHFLSSVCLAALFTLQVNLYPLHNRSKNLSTPPSVASRLRPFGSRWIRRVCTPHRILLSRHVSRTPSREGAKTLQLTDATETHLALRRYACEALVQDSSQGGGSL